MKIFFLSLIALLSVSSAVAQSVLVSWSQQNIANYTQEMYDAYQVKSQQELLEVNRNLAYWSEVFLVMNASLNNFSTDLDYQKKLVNELNNTAFTPLKGSSRLVIWDRIVTKDLIFEGKGLVFENDLFTVAGRVNQLLQSLTQRNFGYVHPHTTPEELVQLQQKWLAYLQGESVEQYTGLDLSKGRIPEICSLSAMHALIVALQESAEKEAITRKCLKQIYGLDALPEQADNPANYCNPDTYTLTFLLILMGEEKQAKLGRDAKWWLDFWQTNKEKLAWNAQKGHFELVN